METNSTQRLTALQRQKRQLTVDALIRAAQRGLHERGLDVTVDEIAALAGVGRRTVFRHFATREDLLQEAFAASADDYLRAVPQYSGGDWEAWLADLTRVTHQAAAVAGQLSWEIRTRQLPPRLAAAHAEQLQALRRVYTTTAATLWEAAGGQGVFPERLRQTVAVHLSPLFTQAVVREVDGTAELAAELAATAIAATVRQLLTH